MMLRTLYCLCALAFIGGCTLLTDPGSFEDGESGDTGSDVLDTGAPDLGVDADSGGDTGADTSLACERRCDDDGLVCAPSGMCVQCVMDGDCGGGSCSDSNVCSCDDDMQCSLANTSCFNDVCTPCDADGDTYNRGDPACIVPGQQADCDDENADEVPLAALTCDIACAEGEGVLGSTAFVIGEELELGSTGDPPRTVFGGDGAYHVDMAVAQLDPMVGDGFDGAAFFTRPLDTDTGVTAGQFMLLRADEVTPEEITLPEFSDSVPYEATMRRDDDDRLVFAVLAGRGADGTADVHIVRVAPGGTNRANVDVPVHASTCVLTPHLDPIAQAGRAHWIENATGAFQQWTLDVLDPEDPLSSGADIGARAFPWMGGGPYASAAYDGEVRRWGDGIVGVEDAELPGDDAVAIGPLANSDEFTIVPTASGPVFVKWTVDGPVVTRLDLPIRDGIAIATFAMPDDAGGGFLIALGEAEGVVIHRLFPDTPDENRYGLILRDLDGAEFIALDATEDEGLIVGILEDRGDAKIQRVTFCPG